MGGLIRSGNIPCSLDAAGLQAAPCRVPCNFCEWHECVLLLLPMRCHRCSPVAAALPLSVTFAGLIQPELLPDGQVCVDMGEPILEGPKVPTTLAPTQVGTNPATWFTREDERAQGTTRWGRHRQAPGEKTAQEGAGGKLYLVPAPCIHISQHAQG